MEICADQSEVIGFLGRAASYGLTGTVERAETHGAIVFLAGDHAYKLKRAVRFPYMDYSTPEKRRAMCARELEVNRDMAPEIYLEVRAIARGGDGTLRFAKPNDPSALDWVVVMRRFEQQTLFGRMCEAGRLIPELMRALGERLAAFHGAADVMPGFGGAQGIADVVNESVSLLGAAQESDIPAARVKALRALSDAMLARVSPLLDARRDDGKVRRCHGDLHLDNVCLISGKPVLFDAIEFEDKFANIDVLYDLAFLLMDLDHHQARPLASALLNRYLECTRDYDGLAALPVFLSCRASIRAHVNLSRSETATLERKAYLAETRRYLDEACAYLSPPTPRLIVAGGLSGTGKTTLARALAPRTGAAPGAMILRSDVTRKQLMGVAETVRLSESAYTPAVNRRVFAEMAALAARILAAGHAVVMDAVYGTKDERDEIEAVAARANVKFDGLWLTADADILALRIAARSGDASDATVAVLKQQLSAITAPQTWTIIDAGGTPATIAEDAARRLNLLQTQGPD
ncbi:MAG: AAA family ATPase [Pseudomonadota bacterium]|nr:AAA family ATPase [Pseudomonadota bacterium]